MRGTATLQITAVGCGWSSSEEGETLRVVRGRPAKAGRERDIDDGKTSGSGNNVRRGERHGRL
jgi:hypothetical protein